MSQLEPIKVEQLFEIPMQIFFILLCFVVECVMVPCRLVRALLTLVIEGVLVPMERSAKRLHEKMRGQVRTYVTE